ncbi:MAG TPA: hypothetical protein DEA62_00520 [Coxiellaceae bacterium]|nr:hypothetical protein [Coxiellaceae bacterium]HBY55518.1 hypothetical protein [Coxiellaceae bacterium]
MRKFYNLFIKSEFLKNSYFLIGGSSSAVLIQALGSPFLTRLYSPTEFGIFALFFSVVTFLSVIVTAKYELTIILPKDDADSAFLVLLSIIAATVLSLITLCISAVIIFMNFFESDLWLYFVPFVCLFVGFFQSSCYWLIRQKRFRILASIRILQSVAIIALSILFAFVLPRNFGLILGYAIGQLVASISIFMMVVKDVKVYWREANIAVLLKLIKRYKNFPLYSNLSGLIESFAAQMPIFFLTAFFGKGVAGFYSLAQRVTRVPVSVISTAVGDVFRQKASSEYAIRGECRAIFIKVFLSLTALAIVPCITFFFIAPYLFNLVFGAGWKVAGEYARILTGILFLQFIVSPLSNMFIIAEKQKVDFAMQIYLIIVSVFSFWCGYYFFHSAKLALIFFTFAYSTKYLFELFVSYRFSLGIRKGAN